MQVLGYAEAFHLSPLHQTALQLHELRFDLLVRGNILNHGDGKLRLPIGSEDERGVHVRPDHVTIPVEVPFLDKIMTGLACDQIIEQLPGDPFILRVSNCQVILINYFLSAVTEHGLKSQVAIEQFTIHTFDQDTNT